MKRVIRVSTLVWVGVFAIAAAAAIAAALGVVGERNIVVAFVSGFPIDLPWIALPVSVAVLFLAATKLAFPSPQHD